MHARRTYTLLLAAAGLAASAVTSPALASDARQGAPSDPLSVEIVTVNGTGCPAGTTQVDMSPGNDTVNLSFSSFVASQGPGLPTANARKNCMVSMRLVGVPDGYSYAVVRAEYRGYAKIADGAKGQHAARYYFQGSPANQDLTTPFQPGYNGEFTIVDTVEASKAVWSPCGKGQRNLNANVAISVTGGKKDVSMIAQEAADLSAGNRYSLAWKRC